MKCSLHDDGAFHVRVDATMIVKGARVAKRVGIALAVR